MTKEQVKKYGLGVSRNYGQITDEMEQKCVGKNFKKFYKILPISDLKVIGTKLIVSANGDW